MKKIFLGFLGLTLFLTSCQKDTGTEILVETPNVDAFYDNTLGQTPIGINDANTLPLNLENISFNYSNFDGVVKSAKTSYIADDNGVTIAPFDEYNLKVAVNGSNDAAVAALGKYNSDNYIVINDQKYYLIQYHFHYDSEHELNGKRYDMEVHFVHQATSGKVAVVGVFINKSAQANATLETIFDLAPATESATTTDTLFNFNASSLFPTNTKDYYTYSGSLTTPFGGVNVLKAPYFEGLRWFVLANPINVSEESYNHYIEIYEHKNARPIQLIGARKVYHHTVNK